MDDIPERMIENLSFVGQRRIREASVKAKLTPKSSGPIALEIPSIIDFLARYMSPLHRYLLPRTHLYDQSSIMRCIAAYDSFELHRVP